MQGTQNILLLDGNEQSAQDIQRFLKISAYTFALSHVASLQEGINYLKSRKPDLILLDAELLADKDFPTFKSLVQKDNVPSILMSDNSNTDISKQAGQAGAVEYLVKNKINLFHLQKTIANVLKLSETEAKLDSSYNEFSAQHESLYKVLNKMNSGVLVINAHNTIRYANTKAYNILGEVSLKYHIAEHLHYRHVDEDEQIDLKPNKNIGVNIRISNLIWNGEPANLFILDNVNTKEAQKEGLMEDENFLSVFNMLNENVILLKGDTVVQANRSALQILKQKPKNIIGKNLSEIFEGTEKTTAEMSVQSFLSDRLMQGSLKISDGSEQTVTGSIKPLYMGEDFYQFFTFQLNNPIDNAPSSRSEEGKFSSQGVLHLASHDLREPVRTILNYVQLISENLKSGKIEEAKEFTDFAKSAASRMEKLLSDLKLFIGLNEHPYQVQKVSMKLVLADVLKQMKSQIEEVDAEVSFADLPDIRADRDLVEKLLAQLIDNALKFRKKDKRPVIDIGYDKFEGNIIFCVRDNGIGISKKYYQKIFELFEKLNRVDEYPGNGLGLAICKKITDIHGGDIWVESLPGSGSNFYFTLRGK